MLIYQFYILDEYLYTIGYISIHVMHAIWSLSINQALDMHGSNLYHFI